MDRITVLVSGSLSKSMDAAVNFVRRDRRIELVREDDPMTALQVIAANAPCILVASITDAESLRLFTDFVKKIDQDTFYNDVRTIVSNRYREQKLLQHLSKLGVKNIIDEPVKAKNFSFKFDLLVKALQALKVKYEEQAEASGSVSLRNEKSELEAVQPAESSSTDNEACSVSRQKPVRHEGEQAAKSEKEMMDARDLSESDIGSEKPGAAVVTAHSDTSASKSVAKEAGTNQTTPTAPPEPVITHKVPVGELGTSKDGLWRKVGDVWIFISVNLFYEGAESPSDAMPIWVNRGEGIPTFNEDAAEWEFYGAAPVHVDTVEALDDEVFLYISNLFEQYQESREKLAAISELRANPELEEGGEEREYSQAPDIITHADLQKTDTTLADLMGADAADADAADTDTNANADGEPEIAADEAEAGDATTDDQSIKKAS